MGRYGQAYSGRCEPTLSQPRTEASRHLGSCPPPSLRYMVLTGNPPFVAASLSEMYENIREGRYHEPAHVSPNACRLIARLLAPNPAERPSLDHLLQDNFFTQVCDVQQVMAPGCLGPSLGCLSQGPGRVRTPGGPGTQEPDNLSGVPTPITPL